VGLDVEKAKRDMESPGTVAVLKQDTSDVMTLQVQKTPTFYVNGKPLADMSENGLRYLVRQEVKAAYP
jgi:predicted DsbA family dithiol-disulfide isomerase